MLTRNALAFRIMRESDLKFRMKENFGISPEKLHAKYKTVANKEGNLDHHMSEHTTTL